jgi:polyisoprenoid-binding protein YceI
MTMHPADTTEADAVTSERWRIDPSRSRVELRVRTWGLGTVKGSFARFHGTLDLSAQPAITFTIEGESLDTGNRRRDEHLRGPDFLDADAHPYLRFTSETATLDGERLIVHGRLDARAASMPLSFEVRLRGIGDELVIDALVDVDHRKLGVTWNVLRTVRTPSRLLVTGRMVRDEE